MTMKLFVVGESSPDPDEWNRWSEYCLVIAETPERALELTEKYDSHEIAEIPLDKEILLHCEPEHPWGDDL